MTGVQTCALPILYSIALSIEADYLPPFVNPTEIIQEYYITVSDTAEISIVPNSGAYALAEDLEKLKTDIENTGILGGGSEGGEEDDNTIIGTMKKDIADLKNPVFDFVEERENVESEDTHKTLWGKVKKWFSDLKDAAFCSVVNHCLATKPGTVLDGRVGTDLQEQINGLKQEDERINSNINGNILTYDESEDAYYIQHGADAVRKKLGDLQDELTLTIPMHIWVYGEQKESSNIMIKISQIDGVYKAIIVSAGNARLHHLPTGDVGFLAASALVNKQ